MRWATLLPAVALLSLSNCCLHTLSAKEKSAAELMPSTTVLYGEMAAPPALLDSLLKHPVRNRVESIDAVEEGLKSKQFLQFRFIVGLVEWQLDMDWKEAFKGVTAGGVYAGVDAETEGVVVLAKSRDEKTLEKLVNHFLKMARDDAKKKKKPDPVEEHEYRGLKAYKIDDGVMARVGPWLMLSNKGELAKQVADRYLDDSAKGSLAENAQFKTASATIDQEKPTVWLFADTKTLRDAGAAKKLFQEKSDNPLAELLLGGVLAAAQKTPYATASLDLNEERFALTLESPCQDEWIPQTREFYFGSDGKGVAPAPLRPKQTLLSIEAFRDVSQLWLAKEELFEEKIVAQLAQADSQFSTLFSGLDFGEEVLGSLKAPVQIVLARQNFEDLKTPQPDIRLPAGALVLELKEPEAMSRRLKVAYQSLIGFVNIGLSQKGMPQLDMETERRGEARIVSATYLPDDSREGMINYNFSPSLAFVGPRLIVSSTRELALDLAELASKGDSGQPSAKLNTHASLDVGVLKKTLADNRDQLVAQNVLEKGHTKEQGEKEIDTLLDLLDAAKDLTLRLSRRDDRLQLGVELTFAGEE